MSKLARTVGTKSKGAEAPVEYEIPRGAIAEAIVNALAHRDYSSNAVIQVMIFSDRLKIWNPGQFPPGLTPEWLRKPHASIPKNPLIAEPLFLAHYIEKEGTGILDMIRLCRETGLPEPDFEQRGNQFVTTLWRDWLTPEVLGQYNLNSRQVKAIQFVKTNGKISNSNYQKLTGAIKKTASRDLDDLIKQVLFIKIGKTGRGVHYVLSKKGT